MQIEKCLHPFRNECFSPAGRELRSLIERHSDEMVAESLSGNPALAGVIPHLPLRLAEALKTSDPLMHAFGHMAKLEMEERGLREQGTPKDYNWPIVRTISTLVARFN
ncbi:hypothetical protein [Methylocella sp.]|jgi:hypothetical protein|uniref:hypothetical protein n=1 Tax=Methylocella sp. TaxID=1978226 RepID=UPI003C24CE82